MSAKIQFDIESAFEPKGSKSGRISLMPIDLGGGAQCLGSCPNDIGTAFKGRVPAACGRCPKQPRCCEVPQRAVWSNPLVKYRKYGEKFFFTAAGNLHAFARLTICCGDPMGS